MLPAGKRRRGRASLAGAIVSLAIALPAGISQADSANPPDCILHAKVLHAKVARVEETGVLVLSNGRAATLEGLLLPGPRDGAPDSLRRGAVLALRQLSRGILTIAARPPEEDRYGRVRAQIVLPHNYREPWLQIAMLKRGLARVWIAPDRRECARELYTAEEQARLARQGLWSIPAYAIRPPDSLESPALLNTFQIVQGTVVNAAVRGSRAYLNFGRNWRTDFTATIAPQDVKRFKAEGIDPENYAGKAVRVRGWIERMNGPEIQISSPAQIEIVQ